MLEDPPCSKKDFIMALCHCLSSTPGRTQTISHIVVYGLYSRDSLEIGNLAPLQETCNRNDIGFSFDIRDPEVWEYDDPPEIRIFCEDVIGKHAREFITKSI